MPVSDIHIMSNRHGIIFKRKDNKKTLIDVVALGQVHNQVLRVREQTWPSVPVIQLFIPLHKR